MSRSGILTGILVLVMSGDLACARAALAGDGADAATPLVMVLPAGRIVLSDAHPSVTDVTQGEKEDTPEAFEKKWTVLSQRTYPADMNDALNSTHGDVVTALMKSGNPVVAKSKTRLKTKGDGVQRCAARPRGPDDWDPVFSGYGGSPETDLRAFSFCLEYTRRLRERNSAYVCRIFL